MAGALVKKESEVFVGEEKYKKIIYRLLDIFEESVDILGFEKKEKATKMIVVLQQLFNHMDVPNTAQCVLLIKEALEIIALKCVDPQTTLVFYNENTNTSKKVQELLKRQSRAKTLLTEFCQACGLEAPNWEEVFLLYVN